MTKHRLRDTSAPAPALYNCSYRRIVVTVILTWNRTSDRVLGAALCSPRMAQETCVEGPDGITHEVFGDMETRGSFHDTYVIPSCGAEAIRRHMGPPAEFVTCMTCIVARVSGGVT